MAAVALLNPTAELDEILVGVDDAAFDGLRGPRVVLAVVERNPAPAKFIALLDF
jgi:hypothetical protein